MADWADCERLVEQERKKGRLTLWQPAFTLSPFFNLLKLIMLWKTTMILATIASPPLCFIIYHCQSCWLPTVLLTARTMHCTRQGTKDKGYLHQSRNIESHMKNWLVWDLAESHTSNKEQKVEKHRQRQNKPRGTKATAYTTNKSKWSNQPISNKIHFS